jgi:hypothetical protein
MTVLVTGATAGAVTVDPERAALPAGVPIFTRLTPAVLAGVDVMYLAPHLPTVLEACRRAAAAGVGLAGPRGGIWQPVEDAVEAKGIPSTHLEPGESCPIRQFGHQGLGRAT